MGPREHEPSRARTRRERVLGPFLSQCLARWRLYARALWVLAVSLAGGWN